MINVRRTDMEEHNKNINRRDFLKIVGISAATTTAAATLYSCKQKDGVIPGGSTSTPVPTDKMTYRTSVAQKDRVSLLGYGCMRWPTVPSPDGKGDIIDQDAVNELVDYAIAHGVNYFDTSPVYVQGWSEKSTGIALKRHPREKLFIATKLSNFSNYSRENSIAMYRKSFEDLQTDYIDYYLLHSIGNGGIEAFKARYIDNGMMEFLLKEREAGRIRNLGFSFHDTYPVFRKILTYRQWDFCQIQYNYMDEYSQAGVEGLRYANAKGLPVIIMEPLRGGRLVNLLPESAKKLFRADKEGRTPAELALKWLYNQPEVTCVLSGMNSMEMVEQNLKTASESYVGCLTASDAALIEQVKEEIKKHVKVGCTGCGYCMPCPRGVDIPGTFRCYNAMYSEGKQSGRKDYLQCTAFRKDTASASQCVGCGKCEKHCPQHIEIRKELKCAASELEDVKYKVMKSAIQILKLW